MMYKVRCHGNDQEMTFKLAVFVKYGVEPVQRYQKMFATSGVQSVFSSWTKFDAWIFSECRSK